MDDLISRQDAITIPVMPKEDRQYQTMNIDDAYERGWYDLQDCIESLPSAEPKTGYWMLLEYEFLTCSECGDDHWTGCESTEEAKERLKSGDYPNYCSNCGAKMNNSFYRGHTSRV